MLLTQMAAELAIEWISVLNVKCGWSIGTICYHKGTNGATIDKHTIDTAIGNPDGESHHLTDMLHHEAYYTQSFLSTRG